MGQRAGEGMAEAFFVEIEEACPRDPEMIAPFFAWIDSRPFQFAAVDQVADGTSGNGEERGNNANFDERWNELFLKHGTICNHRVEFLDILTRL
jgi:hypothetical protein